jgi:hypothetical protein
METFSALMISSYQGFRDDAERFATNMPKRHEFSDEEHEGMKILWRVIDANTHIEMNISDVRRCGMRSENRADECRRTRGQLTARSLREG